MSAPSDRLYGLERILAGPALFMAVVAALTLPLSLFPAVTDAFVLRPLACAAATMAALIFLRLLISPAHHHAMLAAFQAMNPKGPFLGPRIRWSDPEWGWNGAKMGTGLIVPLRKILFAEFIVTVLLGQVVSPWLIVLMFAGTMLVILLSQSQLRDHFPRPDRSVPASRP